mmetsp:Transcript_5647/g.14336  ORF Transcript_5647/g.14336 Transcript_5647/m.14336 type:complete len:208 (+) Transcript_5647:1280-1903(+)
MCEPRSQAVGTLRIHVTERVVEFVDTAREGTRKARRQHFAEVNGDVTVGERTLPRVGQPQRLLQHRFDHQVEMTVAFLQTGHVEEELCSGLVGAAHIVQHVLTVPLDDQPIQLDADRRLNVGEETHVTAERSEKVIAQRLAQPRYAQATTRTTLRELRGEEGMWSRHRLASPATLCCLFECICQQQHQLSTSMRISWKDGQRMNRLI